MKIKVVNQRLYLEPPETAEGTREYLRAEFSFSEEWEGTVKTAFFRGADGNHDRYQEFFTAGNLKRWHSIRS